MIPISEMRDDQERHVMVTRAENLWQDQRACRVDTHDVECIDLLGYCDGTQFGSDIGIPPFRQGSRHMILEENSSSIISSGGIARNPSRHPWTLDVQFHLDTDYCTDEE